MRKFKCINSVGSDGYLSRGTVYEEIRLHPNPDLFVIRDDKGATTAWSYTRFLTLKEEIEMKTPPEPCKCKQTAPVQQPRPENNLQDYNAAGDGLLLTRTDWRIARNTLAKLEQQLRCGVVKPDETYEIVRTVTHILKG